MNVDDIRKMNELRRQGKSLQEIADAFGVNYLTVRRLVDEEFRDRKIRRRSIKYEGVRRPNSERCELCGAMVRLEFHHWDDNKGDMGLHLCWHCHRYAEAIDYDEAHGEERRKKYLAMKEEETTRYEKAERPGGKESSRKKPREQAHEQVTSTFDELRAKLGIKRSAEHTLD